MNLLICMILWGFLGRVNSAPFSRVSSGGLPEKLITTKYIFNFNVSETQILMHPCGRLKIMAIHVNVWQKPLQYCKVLSLQLIKINEKKKENNGHNISYISPPLESGLTLRLLVTDKCGEKWVVQLWPYAWQLMLSLSWNIKYLVNKTKTWQIKITKKAI